MLYWLVSCPECDGSKERTWNLLQQKTTYEHDFSINYKFQLPELRVGTLDSLLVLSDDLVKVTAAVRLVARSSTPCVNQSISTVLVQYQTCVCSCLLYHSNSMSSAAHKLPSAMSNGLSLQHNHPLLNCGLNLTDPLCLKVNSLMEAVVNKVRRQLYEVQSASPSDDAPAEPQVTPGMHPCTQPFTSTAACLQQPESLCACGSVQTAQCTLCSCSKDSEEPCHAGSRLVSVIRAGAFIPAMRSYPCCAGGGDLSQRLSGEVQLGRGKVPPATPSGRDRHHDQRDRPEAGGRAQGAQARGQQQFEGHLLSCGGRSSFLAGAGSAIWHWMHLSL